MGGNFDEGVTLGCGPNGLKWDKVYIQADELCRSFSLSFVVADA